MDAFDTQDAERIEQSYLRKLFYRLIPLLAVLYAFCLLDRGNVSLAALTMKNDLHFSDTVYGTGAGIFFVGYFIFEVPSNLIMEKAGARRWIARIMFTWGIVSAAMMFVHTAASFYVLRCLLGIAEAGFYPGILLYLTYWVPANARARFLSRFLATTAVLGLIGGPLGGLLLKMNGWHGLAGWQWLFLVEGIPSILMSFLVLRMLPDVPAHAKWLTDDEKRWLEARIAHDNRTQNRLHHISWRVAFSDRRIVYLCLIFILTSTAGNAIGYFGPQLIKSSSGGTWSDSFIAIIGIVPGLAGAISMTLAARHSDRTGKRRLHVVIGYCLAGLSYLLCIIAPSAGFVILAFSINALGERIAAGSYWAIATNLMGARAAAGGLAFINSFGNLGGFFGPVLMGEFKRLSGGGYTLGLGMAATLMLLASCLSFFAFRLPAPAAEPAPASGV